MDFRKQPILFSLTPFTRLLFSVLLIIVCFSIVFLAGLFLAMPLFGITFSEMLQAMSDVDNAQTIRVLEFFQVLQSIGLFIFPPLIAGFLFEGSSITYLKLGKSSRWMVYLATVALMFAMLPFINWMVTLNESMKLPPFLSEVEQWMKSSEEAAARLTEAFLKMPTLGGLIFNLLMVAMLPALGEELLFRGLLQRLFREMTGNIHVAIWLAAFLFSALHMQFYGFFPRWFLGVIFGYLFYHTGSIWVPVLGHFVNNAGAVVVSYLAQHTSLSMDIDSFGATGNGFYIFLSALVSAGLLWIVYRFSTSGSQYLKVQDNQET